MEYLGKIYCISAQDLTRDDRTESDASDRLAPIVSLSYYRQLVHRGRIKVARRGGGKGCTALIEVDSLPSDIKRRVEHKYGKQVGQYLHARFVEAYSYDYEAHSYYTRRLTESSLAISGERQLELAREYATNASVVQALQRIKNETNVARKVRQMSKVSLSELTQVAGFFQIEFGHTLPLSPTRLSKVIRDYELHGYESLVSKKFGNANTLKVSMDVKQLLRELNDDPHRPHDRKVWEWYCDFKAGLLSLINQRTGELYNPADYPDLSEKTVGDALGTILEEMHSSKRHDARHDYLTQIRPHHHRLRPKYSLSMVSMDDKDFGVKVRWQVEKEITRDGRRVLTKQWKNVSLKAYVAFDVASGAIIGWAFSGGKKADIFEGCIRSMFRRLLSLGLGCPHEAQVENHLVSEYKGGMMAQGALFPAVRWCGAENSQEKYAESFFRTLKYSYEKYAVENIGRHYAKLRKHKTSNRKVGSESNADYEQEVWDYDVAVSHYEQMFERYNNDLHPKQKLYPGKTRQQVLMECVHPKIQAIDPISLARWAGKHVETTIVRGQLQAGGELYGIMPAHAERLRGRTPEVVACWWEQEDGQEAEGVHLWQDDRYIGYCPKVSRYQVATLERTDADEEAYRKESSRIAKWDSAVNGLALDGVMRLEEGTRKEMEAKPIKVVAMPLEDNQDDDDELDITPALVASNARNAAARGAADI